MNEAPPRGKLSSREYGELVYTYIGEMTNSELLQIAGWRSRSERRKYLSSIYGRHGQKAANKILQNFLKKIPCRDLAMAKKLAFSIDPKDYILAVTREWKMMGDVLACLEENKWIFLHRLVAEAMCGRPLGNRIVVHRNGIRTDNRRANLLIREPSGDGVTDISNLDLPDTRIPIGSIMRGKQFLVQIHVGHTTVRVGLFRSADVAARTFDAIASRINSEARRALNYPDDIMPIEQALAMLSNRMREKWTKILKISEATTITLSNGSVAYIDECDGDLAIHKWYINHSYPSRKIRGRSVSLHRIIAARMFGEEALDYRNVIHIDGDKMNCRRSNLKISSREINIARMRKICN